MKKYNCRACGGQHDTQADLQACHAGKKDASRNVEAKEFIPPAEEAKPQKITPDDMEEFQKIPVDFRAAQWFPGIEIEGVLTGEDRPDHWLDEEGNEKTFAEDQAWIGTLEGGHLVSAGDWIVIGTMGEKYPVKPDIFPNIARKKSEAPTVKEADNCLFIMEPKICPEELSYISAGQYAELRVKGFMSRRGFEVDTVEHS